ncbi:alpha/beta hydrolase, partial [Arthrobacter sp. H5]|uniref:alpha/beta fold hydrolase n=1 Tax=Arthrobacter sp. H5 TaxID=1267973 RepID=UPI0004B67B46
MEALDDGSRTRLTMRFTADPTGSAKIMSRLVDIGREHSKSTRAAFSQLDELMAARRLSLSAAPSRASSESRSLRVGTDDGASLAVTVMRPSTVHRKQTVVLLHGWGAGRRIWRHAAGLLVDAGHEVVLYNLRGHGDSTRGSKPITIDRLAADLGAVVDSLGVKDAVFAGHSGGGTAALAYAASAGAAPAGVVVVSGAAHGQDTPAMELRMMGSRLFTRALGSPVLGRRMLAHTMGASADRGDLETVRRLFASTAPAVRAACFGSTHGVDLRSAIAGLGCPVAVLAGTGDRVVAPELAEQTAETIPGATFESLHGIGHMMPLEAPARVAHAIMAVSATVRSL